MIRYRLPVFLPFALTLAACGSGGASVGGSASESSGTNSGLSGLWERVRGTSVDESRTVEMPALGLIAEAFSASAIGDAFGANSGELLVVWNDDETIDPVDLHVEGYRTSFARDWERTHPPLAQASGSAAHLAYAMPILAALQPRNGWEVNAMPPDPAFDTPFFRNSSNFRSYSADQHHRYMQMLAVSAMFANDVFALIAKDLQGTSLADPDQAQARVLEAYRDIPVSTLRAMLATASDRVERGNFTTDLTGSGNVHFQHSGTGDFVADARGLTWTRAGGVWFGDSRINGQSISFRLASTASMSQREAQSGTQGTGANTRVEGSGGISVGR